MLIERLHLNDSNNNVQGIHNEIFCHLCVFASGSTSSKKSQRTKASRTTNVECGDDEGKLFLDFSWRPKSTFIIPCMSDV